MRQFTTLSAIVRSARKQGRTRGRFAAQPEKAVLRELWVLARRRS